jgi:hypothetical protein
LKLHLIYPVALHAQSAGAAYLRSVFETDTGCQVYQHLLPRKPIQNYNPNAGLAWRVYQSLLHRMGTYQRRAFKAYENNQLQIDVEAVTNLTRTCPEIAIVVPLASIELVLIAARILHSGVPARILVLDCFEQISSGLAANSPEAEILSSEYDFVVRQAKAVAVIGENMRRHISARYARQAVIIPPPGKLTRTDSFNALRSTFKIGFAGSLYAKQEWNALIVALDALQWKLDGKTVRIVFVGAFPTRGAMNGRNVELCGFQDEHATQVILENCDAAYLPYWISLEYKLVAQTSFPSKLVTYISAGLPVLFHGPTYAECFELIARSDIGVSCASHKTPDLHAALSHLMHCAYSEKVSKAITNLVNSDFSPNRVRSALSDFLK